MSCDIFIRSYWKDLEWLRLCLASVEKYCLGFRSVVVVLPRSSEQWLRRRALNTTARIEFCRDYADDYLGQQVSKLLADTFTDADYVCHVDSDCVFFRLTTPEDFISNGRPRILTRPCATIEGHRPWQAPTEKFLGWGVTDDYMRHPPFVYPRWLYARLREHALATHGVNIEGYVTAQPPRGFSEFNALGGLAWRRHRESFVWVDTSVEPPGRMHCRWYWSWGGLDRATRLEIEEVLNAPERR